MREDCEHFARCGKTGHYFDEGAGGMVVCPCLEKERLRRLLGTLYSDRPIKKTALLNELGKSIRIEASGVIARVRRHMHTAALEALRRGMRVRTLTSERVMEVWLGKEEGREGGLRSIDPILDDADLLIFFIGYGEMVNRELPAGILKVLDGCLLRGINVWVVLGDDPGRVSHAYSEEVATRLKEFPKVVV